MIEYWIDKFAKYPRTFWTAVVGFGTLGAYNGWKVTKYGPDGTTDELYTDRALASIINSAAYATPITWPITTFCLLRKAEIHIKQLDKSQYNWLYSEYFGLGRNYAKILSKEKN